MFRRTLIGAALAAFIAIPAIAQAVEPEAPHASWCMLASLQVTQVGSLYTRVGAGKGVTQRFAGAQVFVPAQQGLTAEWIQANVQRHIAEAKMGRSYDCPLDLDGISVNVVSGGTGFWIQISSQSNDTAKEILNRARRLVR
ncbi:MAG TPA: hypothetical protein VG963_10525 [Polyangiaceae bacterium]|nr:hypothetical protein [Polyangiaceae bacterium]